MKIRLLNSFIVLLSFLPLLTANQANALVYQGEIGIANHQLDSGGVFNQIKVKYQFTTLFQEPLERYCLMWTSPQESTVLQDIKFQASVNSSLAKGVYINFTPSHIPKSGEWSMDVNASPSWNEIFNTKDGGIVDEQTAKAIFKNGFTLSDLTITLIETAEAGKKNSTINKSNSHQRLHDRANGLLRKINTYNTSDNRLAGSELDKLLSKLDPVYQMSNTYSWSACSPATSSCSVMSADYVDSPHVAELSYDIDNYTYVFYKIGPLYSYRCKSSATIIESPVDLKIKLHLNVADLQKTYFEKKFIADGQLTPGQFLIFGDRIQHHPDQKKNAGLTPLGFNARLEVFPKATNTCGDIKKNKKNPFEEQEQEELKQRRLKEEAKQRARKKAKLKRLRQEAKDLGAINTNTSEVTLTIWDGGEEDGDKVKIILNDKLINANLRLKNQKQAILLKLDKGMNILEIKAIDCGRKKPNTANYILSQNDTIIEQKEWRLNLYEKGVLVLYFE